MPLTKGRKHELVAEYADMLDQSKALIFTEYRGLTNRQMQDIRIKVREANGVYRVAKLTLLEIAMQERGMTIPEEYKGAPVAIGFCYEEIPGVAKALTDFAGENDKLRILSGLMGDKMLSAKEIKTIADLPPLDVLRAQLLGLLDAPAANLVGVLQAGVSQVVNVLHAYVEEGQGAGD